MKKKLFLFTGIFVGLVMCLTIVKQFMKVVDNPPVTQEILAPNDVKAILRQSCYDCHSNETRITWLQKLPGVSMLVASDVRGARSVLNFSEWNKYTPMEQDALIYLAVTNVNDNNMPPSDYLWIHPNAKVTEKDKAILNAWLISIKAMR